MPLLHKPWTVVGRYMLKMTNIKLKLMTDIHMFQFVEKGVRGGVFYIAYRYGKANNRYMKNYYEKDH